MITGVSLNRGAQVYALRPFQLSVVNCTALYWFRWFDVVILWRYHVCHRCLIACWIFRKTHHEWFIVTHLGYLIFWYILLDYVFQWYALTCLVYPQVRGCASFVYFCNSGVPILTIFLHTSFVCSLGILEVAAHSHSNYVGHTVVICWWCCVSYVTFFTHICGWYRCVTLWFLVGVGKGVFVS